VILYGADMEDLDNSFDGAEQTVDLNCIMPEFADQDDLTGNKIPVKKLSQMFDSVSGKEASTSANTGLKVYLRVRAIAAKLENTITVESATSIVSNAPESSKRAQYSKREERHYAFNHIFSPQSQQNDVFDICVQPLLEKFIQGESCVLFAYGMTNAGKTYTIQGNTANPGILPRLVNAILGQATEQFVDARLQLSMLEIYQEKIFDLLNSSSKREKLTIRDGNGKVEVGKLSAHPIGSDEEAFKLLSTASANR
jgi:kinesin family protein 22